ncbi:MAG TPA: hypothetical protein PLN69_05840 [bacterium]|nr:hypothetical protein [bacterium]
MIFTVRSGKAVTDEILSRCGYENLLIVADQSGLYDDLPCDRNGETDSVRVKGYSEESRSQLDEAVFLTGRTILNYIKLIHDSSNDLILFGWGEHEDISTLYDVIFEDRYEGMYYQPECYKSQGRGYVYSYINFGYEEWALTELLETESNPFVFDAYLAGIEVPKEKSEELVKMNYFDDGDKEMILNGGISGFCSISDFDGVEFFSKTRKPNEIIEYLDKMMSPSIRFIDKNTT